MDNQQERSAALHYIGGLVTGEGCFTILVQTKRHDIAICRPIFSITMNDIETMEGLAEKLKTLDLPVHVSTPTRGGLQIRVAGYKRLKRYTDLLIPYLTGDKKKAAIAVNGFVSSRLDKYPKAPITEDEIQYIADLDKVLGKGTNRRRAAEILRDYMSDFGKTKKR